jgi:phytoene dehydrogenase-like protein
MQTYDAVVIGAGNAGLTAAATLQRGGMRTLLVERHNVPGGCATSFRRGRFEFEVALHQLSGVGSPDQPFSIRGLFEGLGVADRLEFVEEPDLYRAVVPGRLDVTIPADWAGAIDVLEAQFPGNRARLEAFFELVKTTTFWQMAARRGMPVEQIDPDYFHRALRPVKQVMADYFEDEGLMYALTPYWAYLGQPPSVLAFQDFALTLFAYFEFKPWHVRGGSQAMSGAILDAFLKAGGEVRFNTEVVRITQAEGRVAGVVLDDGRQIAAREVVSNASLPVTYGMLDEVPPEVTADLATRRVGVSGFVLHMGLDATAEELGFTASTMFINADTDDDRTFASWHTLEPARAVGVTCYDVAPIGFSPPGTCHVTLMTLQYAEAWDDVAPQDYARTKFAYAQTLLDLLETTVPGVRSVIEEVDVATPLTMEHYLGHPGGAFYGYDQDPTESWLFRNSERDSHVAGLHLAGSWAGMAGFQPTLEAGARTARRILRKTAGV